MLRALESSAEGCRRLIAEWTRILDWLGELGPEGLMSSEIHSRLDYIHRVLRLVGMRVEDPDAVAVATADPLAAAFLRAWQAIRDQAILELMEQDADEDDDDDYQADGPEPEPGLTASRWAEVSVALGKLAAARCARLNTELARYQACEVEARARLAYEASFDDSAEGERLHRYQARWGRSLLRTLAMLEELRGHGSPADAEGMSHRCKPMDTDQTAGQERPYPGEETPGREDRVGNVTSEVIPSNAGAGIAGGEVEAVMAMGSAARHEEKVQIKPTAVKRTVVKKVKMEPCVLRSVGSKASMAPSPCWGSDQSGPFRRPRDCAAVVNYPCRQ